MMLHSRVYQNDGRYEVLSHNGKLLEGLNVLKYAVRGDNTSLTLTIFNVSVGIHSYACRTTGNATIVRLIVTSKLNIL